MRPALPRASSATSGFFFCGMMLDPVEYASSGVTKPNSLVAHRMTSSASRDRSTAIIAATNANSATMSRLAVPSIEFSTGPAKPSSAATAAGSRPSEEPASAPEPYGERAARESQSTHRSTSRISGHACASRWCASSTGWACCMCVRPGIGASPAAAACPMNASTTSSTSPPRPRACSRRYMRTSVAIWSLRERPARSLPPSSPPARSMRPRSRAVWTSSSSGAGRKAPDATSARSRSSASTIPASSPSSSRPAPWSTCACAIEPAMSCPARRQSKCVDFDSAASASAGPPENRPPHRLTRPAAAPAGTAPADSGTDDPTGVAEILGVAEPHIPRGGQLRRQAIDLDEAAGGRLVERVAGVVRREVEVVQARVAAPTRHGGPSAVQHDPDVTRDVALGVRDEDVKGLLQRREPLAVVDQLGPALAHGPLEPRLLTLDRDVLELLVCGDESHGAGRLVDLARLDADEAVLDHVDPPDALRARAAVHLLDGLERCDRHPVKSDRHTLLERDDDLVGDRWA